MKILLLAGLGSALSLLLLLAVAINSGETISGKIEKVTFGNGVQEISLEGKNTSFLLFSKKRIALDPEEKISLIYKTQKLSGQEQQVIQKMWKH